MIWRCEVHRDVKCENVLLLEKGQDIKAFADIAFRSGCMIYRDCHLYLQEL